MSNKSSEIVFELLKKGESVRFVAGGPSMNPTIKDGEVVEVAPLDRNSAIRKGQIILFKKYNRLLLHRVIHMTTSGILAAGDAAVAGYEIIARKDVIGVAAILYRKNRLIQLNTRCARIKGRVRYLIRPLRRLIYFVTTRGHTGTPI